MNFNDPKYRSFVSIAMVIFAIDRAAKAWVKRALEPGEHLSVIDGFLYVTHARNPGGVFGVFADAPLEWKAALFGSVAALALFVVILHLRSLAPRDSLGPLALALVAGGAIGNVVDRIPPLGTGEVIDLLQVRLWGGYPWPDFNVADAAIVLGVAALIIDMTVRESAERSRAHVHPDSTAASEGIDVDETHA